MKKVNVTPTAIKHRADKAERIGSALAGVTTVLIQDDTHRQEGREDERGPLDPVTRGNLFEALLALSDQSTDLANFIDQLGHAKQEGQS